MLNPHYKDMGNLYGSEYWTYLLPQRVGAENAKRLTQARLPMGAAEGHRLGVVDRILPFSSTESSAAISQLARSIAMDGGLDARLIEKRRRREQDEADKPLDAYRSEELARLYLNFLASIQATTWHATISSTKCQSRVHH